MKITRTQAKDLAISRVAVNPDEWLSTVYASICQSDDEKLQELYDYRASLQLETDKSTPEWAASSGADDWDRYLNANLPPLSATSPPSIDDMIPLSQKVNIERDRRIASRFIFNGVPFDFDPASKQRITGAATLAKFAVAAGVQPGNLRWMNPNVDFSWIASDNTFVTMDAQTCSAFGDAAALHEQAHIFAARTLKNMNPIPSDHTDNKYWP